MLDTNTVNLFSPRELQVAFLSSLGLKNQDIASRLFISNRTVTDYVEKILKKLNLSNRTQLAVYWAKEGSIKYASGAIDEASRALFIDKTTRALLHQQVEIIFFTC